RLSYSKRDGALMGLLSIGAGIQGLLLPDLAGPGATHEQRGGGMAVAMSTALLAGALIAQGTDVHPADAGQGVASMLVGDVVGAGVAMLAKAESHDVSRAALISGSAMLVGGSVLAPYLDYSKRDALLTTQLGLGGFVQGLMIADTFSRDVSATRRLGGAMVGLGAGVLGGALVAQGSEVAAGDTGEMALGLVAGDALAGGISLLAGLSQQNAMRTMLIGGSALWLAAGLRAPYTRYSAADAKLISLTALGGSMLGSFIPVHRHGSFDSVSAREIGGGAAAGFGGGLVLGSLLAQQIELPTGAATEMVMTSAGGMLFGAGLGMMLPVSDHRPIVGLMQGFGVAGAVGGALLAERTHYSGPDRLLTTLAVAYGGWQGVGASLLFNGTDRQVAGAVMATAGLGYLGGALISQYIDLSYTEVWTLFSGSIWGAWIGGFAANLARNKGADLTGRHITGIAMLASDLGIALSALTLTPLLGWTPARLGWVNLSGMLGMSLATGIGAAFSGEAAQIGTIAGASGGLAAGVIITSLMSWAKDRPRSARNASARGIAGGPGALGAAADPTASAAAAAAAQAKLPSGLGKVIADWAPLLRVEPPTDLAGRPVSDGMQLTVGVTGMLH
ncbi:MAG: hypothetical protein KC503_42780, partial [Myxococcales bacterium]|nr:hypothetical protein [Myxococcales bacterium]